MFVSVFSHNASAGLAINRTYLKGISPFGTFCRESETKEMPFIFTIIIKKINSWWRILIR